MFTGLVECVGSVLSVSRRTGGVRVLRVHAPDIAPEVKLGDSISVSGACLTATAAGHEAFEVEMMEETVRSTRLGSLKTGECVNLERALRLGARLDGHLVAGHIDEVAVVTRMEDAGETKKCWFSVSAPTHRFIAGKGSIAVDGVSLTVIDAPPGEFSVGLIPTTLRDTTIESLLPGHKVNVEVDMIARYIAKLMLCGATEETPAAAGVTWEKMREYGWI